MGAPSGPVIRYVAGDICILVDNGEIEIDTHIPFSVNNTVQRKVFMWVSVGDGFQDVLRGPCVQILHRTVITKFFL